MAIPPEPSIGDLVDANAEANANAAAMEAVENIPPTTVVVENEEATTDPQQALAYADDIRRIAREEANANMLAWIALAEANEPPAPEPEVVIVTQTAPEPAPAPNPIADLPPTPEATADEPPPREHLYHRPLWGRKK
jgi:hypothetical protein